MLVKVLGRRMLVKLAQPLKTYETRRFTPSGTMILVSWPLPSKMDEPAFSRPRG